MKRKQAWTLYKEEETAIEELCSDIAVFDAGKPSGM